MNISAERIGYIVIELADGRIERFYPGSISVLDNGRGKDTTLNIKEKRNGTTKKL